MSLMRQPGDQAGAGIVGEDIDPRLAGLVACISNSAIVEAALILSAWTKGQWKFSRLSAPWSMMRWRPESGLTPLCRPS